MNHPASDRLSSGKVPRSHPLRALLLGGLLVLLFHCFLPHHGGEHPHPVAAAQSAAHASHHADDCRPLPRDRSDPAAHGSWPGGVLLRYRRAAPGMPQRAAAPHSPTTRRTLARVCRWLL